MAIAHSPGCKIYLLGFGLFSTLESDYIQCHKYNVSGTPPANKAIQIFSCTANPSICTIYKGRSQKGSSLSDQEKVSSEETVVVSSSLLYCDSSIFRSSAFFLIFGIAMPLFDAYASGHREAITVTKYGIQCYTVSFPL